MIRSINLIQRLILELWTREGEYGLMKVPGIGEPAAVI